MAEIKIDFEYDLASGKYDIIVSMGEDDELLPHEHEKAHRAWVEKIVGKWGLKPDDVGKVKVSRIRGAKMYESPNSAGPERERERERGR